MASVTAQLTVHNLMQTVKCNSQLFNSLYIGHEQQSSASVNYDEQLIN